MEEIKFYIQPGLGMVFQRGALFYPAFTEHNKGDIETDLWCLRVLQGVACKSVFMPLSLESITNMGEIHYHGSLFL